MLGEAIEKAKKEMGPDVVIMIVNAAGQVIFRGYAANTESAGIRKTRRVKRYGIGMETYKATEKMWDWKRIDALPPQVPVEQFGEYKVGELKHILYIRIELDNEFTEGREDGK